ncbi:MAG: limonene-1,2-epoxide hydrolase [Candidatus Azotimanducaceae bacterium]|jgi:limonene-1,2-epoxide hydrolase
MKPIQVVENFIDAWNRMDWEAVVSALADDVIYHNIPMEKLEGKQAAAAFIRGMKPEGVDWETLSIAENGNKVLTERIDRFDMAGGKKLVIPVMGVFEIENDKIKAWRDYFDLQTFTSQVLP